MSVTEFDDFINDIPSKEDTSDKKEYEDRLVAVIDLLGISKKIEESANLNTDNEPEETIVLLERITDCVFSYFSQLLKDDDKSTLIQMSDSFVFVCKIECLKDLIKALAAIQNDILIKENNAIYPRIIICNSIKDLVDYKDDSVKKYICHDKEEIIDYIDFSLDCDVLEKEVFIFFRKKVHR